MLNQALRLLLITLAMLAGCAAKPAATVQIDNAWLRSPLAGRPMSAGYFSIHNPTPTQLVLVSAASEQTGTIELHTHITDGDMMRMRRLHELAIPAGARIDFKPGGHHLMVSDLPSDAETVIVTLGFAGGTSASAEFDVRSPTTHTGTR